MSLKELLAPAGGYDVFKVAVNAGADAIYLAGQQFGARAFAQNFTLEEIEKSINYAHLNSVKVYITINTLINNFEIEKVLKYIFKLYKFGVDGIIVQDLGLVSLVRLLFPDLKIHASTQMTLNNYECVLWAYKHGISRVIFPREINIDEISKINSKLKNSGIDLELEVFGHGALCYSISGNCYISSLNSGRSGNRGTCAQPCRREYKLKYNGHNMGTGHLLSTKDLNTSKNLNKLINAGITSLKLEGRMKSEDYIGTIVNSYRNILDYNDDESSKNLNLVFNRKFTKGYLLNDKPKEVMGRNSSGHEGLYIGDITEVKNQEITITKNNDIQLKTGDGIAFKYKDKIKGIYIDNITYQNKDKITFNTTRNVRVGDKVFISYSSKMHKKLKKFRQDNVEPKIPISFDISFSENLYLICYYKFNIEKITLNSKYTSKTPLDKAINKPITEEDIKKQLSKTGGTSFFIDNIKINDLPNDSFISIGELNKIRREILNKASEILLNYWKPNKKEINKCNNNLNNFLNDYNKNKTVSDKKLTLSVFVDNLELLKIASKFPLKKIYFDPSYLYNNPSDYFNNIKAILKKAALSLFDTELVWVLPSFISSEEIEKCVVIFNELLEEGIGLAIMCDIPGLCDKFSSRIYGNHNLNVWNSYTCDILEKSGTLVSGFTGRITSSWFKKTVEDTVKSQVPWGYTPKFEGDRLLYNYVSYDKIKIGDFVFDRYHFGVSYSSTQLASYNNIFGQHNASVNDDFAKLYFIPFFIYKGQLYIELNRVNEPQFDRKLGHQMWGRYNANGDVLNYSIRTNNLSTNYAFSTQNIFRVIEKDNYGTIFENITTPFSQTIMESTWLNVSQFAGANLTTPSSASIATMGQITAGDSPEFINENLHNFSPGQTGSGVFMVPPTFYQSTGMRLLPYLATLNPNEVYTHQPPTTTEHEVNLPDIVRALLENLEDGDEVQIVIDPETGELSFHLIKGNGNITTGPGSGECCCDHKGLLEKILDELKKITQNTSNFASGSDIGNFDEVLTALTGLPSAIVDAIKDNLVINVDVFSNTEPIGTSPGGSTIWDFLSDLINLPAEIAKALFGTEGLAGILKPILDFILGFVELITDIFLYLFVPKKGFFETIFANFLLTFNEKLPIINDSMELMNDFTEILAGSEGKTPDFNIDGELFGAELNVTLFDLNMFRPYLPYIHGVIIAISYIMFIRKLIKRIPQITGGF